MPNLETLKPNEKIKQRYQVIDYLGQGAYGQVYKVQDARRGGNEAVLKYITSENLQIEIEQLRGLRHPNLATFYYNDYDSRRGNFYVMEYAVGDPLHQIAQGLNLAEVISVTRQTAQALDYLHRIGQMVHLDLKPANLIFNREENLLRLIDLDTARSLDETGYRNLNYVPGTIGYLAPELALAKLNHTEITISPETDIYALGVVLYELLAQRPLLGQPLEDDEWLYRQSQPRKLPWLPKTVSPELVELLRQMLAYSPQQRPSAQQVVEKLNQPDLTSIYAFSPEKFTLLGRQEEQVLFEQRLLDCASGTGGFFVISGPAGIGKSRLAIELRTKAHQQGFFTTWNSSSSQDVRPYAPLLRLVQDCLDRAAIVPEESLTKQLTELLPGLAIGQESETAIQEDDVRAETQERLAEALLALFVHLTERQPALLYLDNAQACDLALWQVLKRLQPKLRDQRVLLCLTFRTETPAEQRRLKDFYGKADLSLKPLGQPEIERLVCEAFNLEPDKLGFSGKLAQYLAERTGGRPFYVLDTLPWLEKEGLVSRARRNEPDGGWHHTKIAGLKNLQLRKHSARFTSERIALLEPEEKALACLAALLGADFEEELLVQLVERGVGLGQIKLSDQQLKYYLQRLRNKQIIEREQVEGRCRFTHDLLYQAARREIDQITSQEVAEAIEAIWQVGLEDVLNDAVNALPEAPFVLVSRLDQRPVSAVGIEAGVIALQLAICHQPGNKVWAGFGYSLLAAEYALKANANDRALQWYSQALEQLKVTEHPRFLRFCQDAQDKTFVSDVKRLNLARFWAIKGLARAYRNSGLPHKVAELCQEAVSLAENYPGAISHQLLAQVYELWVAALELQGQFSKAVALANSPFLMELNSSAAISARITAYQALQRLGLREDLRPRLEQTLAQVLANGDKFNQVRCYLMLGLLERYRGNYRQLLIYGTQALEIAEGEQNFEGMDKARAFIILACRNLGDYEQCRHFVKLNLKAVSDNQITTPDRISNVYNDAAQYYYYSPEQNLEKTQSYWRQAYDVTNAAGLIDFKLTLAMNLGLLFFEYPSIQNLPQAEIYFEEARQGYEKRKYKSQLPLFYHNYACYFEVCDNIEKAKFYFGKSIFWARRLKNWGELGPSCQRLAKLYQENDLAKIIKLLSEGWLSWRELQNQDEMKQIAEQLHELYLAWAERAKSKPEREQRKQMAQTWQERTRITPFQN